MNKILQALSICGLFLLLLLPNVLSAQCTGSSQYPSSTITIASDGSITQISSCNYADEYAVTDGYVSGETYEWASSVAGDFLTLTTDAAGSNVLTSGVTPISYTSAGEATLYLHIHLNASCASENSCRTTTAQCTTCTPPPAPGNDLCADAIAATVGVTTGTTSQATSNDYPGVCGDASSNNAPGVWFTYLSSGPETFVVDLCGAGHDSQISVWTGGCGALTCVAGEDDDCGNDPSVQIDNAVTSLVPVEYHIYVFGYSTDTGPFTMNIASAPLPVQLTSFEGTAMDEGNKLTWTTASESNTEYHAIQRSIDGLTNWTTIGMVDAKGSTNSNATYSFMDDRPLSKVYYRLQSVDFDRAESISEVIGLERASSGFTIASTFPNPTRSEVTVQYHSDRNEEISVSVLDISGKILKQLNHLGENGVNNLSIEMADLASGTYFLSISNGIETLNERVVKQ